MISWSLAMTFRIPHKIATPTVKVGTKPKIFNYDELNQFFREFMISDNIKKLGYVAVYSQSGGNHIHLELAHNGEDIPDYRLRILEARWNQIVRFKSGGLVIIKITNKQGWQDYCFQREKHRDKNSITFFFNTRFLKQNQLGYTLIPE